MASMWSVWKQKIAQYFAPSVGKGENPGEKHDHSPAVLRAELQIPHAIIERYEAAQHKSDARERERERIDRWRLGVEAMTLAFVIGGTVMVYKTLKATIKQADIAEQNLIFSERPWISVDATLTTPVMFYEDGSVYVGIDLLMKNVGHTVATGISSQAFVVLSAFAPVSQRNALCERGRRGDDAIHGGT